MSPPSFSAVEPTGQIGDGQVSVVYDCETGEIAIDTPLGLTSINIDSAAGVFVHHEQVEHLGGSFDNHTVDNIFKATFGGSFGSLSFGRIAETGLTEEFVAMDLSVVGSGVGGADLGAADLVYTCGGISRDMSGANLAGQDLAGQDFSFADLRQADLRSANLTGANLSSAILSGANLNQANLQDARLPESDASDADFSNANLQDATLVNALLAGANLQDANLIGADLNGADLTSATLADANLSRAVLSNVNLTDADLGDAIISSASFFNTTGSGLTFDQVSSTASYRQADLAGIWLGRNDLSSWDLSNQNLTGASFSGATLAQTDFTSAVVRGADFGAASSFQPEQLYSTASYQQQKLGAIRIDHSDLAGWDFAGQDLTNAELFSADLSDVVFRRANLTGAKLGGSRLLRADFRDAIVQGTSFGNAQGFTEHQLRSTASYQRRDLTGIEMPFLDLRGWDFSGQDLQRASIQAAFVGNSNFAGANLASASFSNADLTGTTLIGAGLRNTDFFHATLDSVDLRGSTGFSPDRPASTRNMIWPNGEVRGLAVAGGDVFMIRNFNREIRVLDTLFVDEQGVIQFVIDGEDWGSTVHVRAERQIGGLLRIEFKMSDLPFGTSGVTYKLFDWGRPLAPGEGFAHVEVPSRSVWDLSRLNQTGEVTLLGIAAAGDANEDLVFDDADIAEVWAAGKYLTDEDAAWSEGDWNGDERFDQRDIVAALQTGEYRRVV